MGCHIELFNFILFSISVWGIDLDFCDVEWFALETNRDHSVTFEIATIMGTAFCILVDCGGYSFPSKGFLSTAVDIMVM